MNVLRMHKIVRALLDDEEGAPNKVGLFWQPDEIDVQLNASQSYLCSLVNEAHRDYLLRGLITQQQYTVTQARQRVPLPSDYFKSIGATINNQVARVLLSDTALTYNDVDVYAFLINSLEAEIIGSSGGVCQFYYYRTPSLISISGAPLFPRTELDYRLYSAIVLHAAHMLSKKDGNTSRTRFSLVGALSDIGIASRSLHVDGKAGW